LDYAVVGVFEATVFLVFVDSPFEDLREGVLLSDSSVVVVVVVVEPE
jgi:hypothetical protein